MTEPQPAPSTAYQTEPGGQRRLSVVAGWDWHRVHVGPERADGTRTVVFMGNLTGHPNTSLVFTENVTDEGVALSWGQSGPFRLSEAEQAALLPQVLGVTEVARLQGAGEYRVSR